MREGPGTSLYDSLLSVQECDSLRVLPLDLKEKGKIRKKVNVFLTRVLGFLVVLQLLSCVQLFATLRNAACQASLSFTISQRWLKLMSIESVMPSNHLCRQRYPSSSVAPFFPVLNLSQYQSLFFAAGSQNFGASTSVLPMNIQGWFSLGLTGLISLLSTGLSRVFSSTTFQKHQLGSLINRNWSERPTRNSGKALLGFLL